MEIVVANSEHASDIARINKVLDNELVDRTDMDVILEAIENGEYHVALCNGRPVAAIWLETTQGSSCQIHSLASTVIGAGGELVEYAANLCRTLDIPKLYCWSLARYNSRRFYDTMGFKEQFLARRQFGNEDAYFFGRLIE
jgi:N-acetylglutamate synthase-like GNAT family acetyltransferase